MVTARWPVPLSRTSELEASSDVPHQTPHFHIPLTRVSCPSSLLYHSPCLSYLAAQTVGPQIRSISFSSKHSPTDLCSMVIASARVGPAPSRMPFARVKLVQRAQPSRWTKPSPVISSRILCSNKAVALPLTLRQ